MTRRPLLLDLFCGAGGAAEGYHRAGFDVVGVDIDPQPHYPFEFIQTDAISLLERFVRGGCQYQLGCFAAAHASPPCQFYAAVTRWRGSSDAHPDLIAPTRNLLTQTGLPWVIENVPGRRTPLRADYRLCGSQFGLAVRRHRWFETSWHGFSFSAPCHHKCDDLPFEHKGERAFADAMGCGWMSAREAREAIPPAYTQFIGEQLLSHLSVAA